MKTNQISNYLLLIAILSLSVLFLGAEGNGCFDPDPEEACYDDSDCANGEICEAGECIESFCERQPGNYMSPYTGECIHFEDGCEVPTHWSQCEIDPPIQCEQLDPRECEEHPECMLEETWIQPDCWEWDCLEEPEPVQICVPNTEQDCVDLDEMECLDTNGCHPVYEDEIFDGDHGCVGEDYDGDEDGERLMCAPIAPWFLYCEEEIIPEGCETLNEDQCWTNPECEWMWFDTPCYCEEGYECGCAMTGQCMDAIWPETCEQYTEWECWEHPECEALYGAADCYCEDDWCACPDVEEFITCTDRMVEDCEFLTEDECWSNPECEWMWYDAMPCYCEDGDYCDCEFIPSGYCVEAYYPAPCEELSEWECWERPECEPYFGGDDDSDCFCGDNWCDCEYEPYFLGCYTVEQPETCEELTEYECEFNPECHLEYFDCLCYEGEMCDCAPNALCVSNDPEPEGCYGLNMEECQMTDGCMYEYSEDCWCGNDPDCWEGQCVPYDVPQVPCEELNEWECYEFSGCEPTYTTDNCNCLMYCEANDPNCCACEPEFDMCVAI